MKAKAISIIVTIALVISLISVLSPPSANPVMAATLLYVGPGQPYQTIQAAVNAASPGDTIVVKARIYNENVDINKSLTVRSESGAAVTIVEATDPNDHVFHVMADAVTITGFTLTGGTGSNTGGVYLRSNTHCTLSRMDLSNNTIGVLALDSADHSFSDITCSLNGWGIYLQGIQRTTISDSIISDCSNAITMQECWYNKLSNVRVYRSWYGIYLSGVGGFNTIADTLVDSSGQAVTLDYSSNNEFTNNVISSSGSVIYCWRSSGNVIYSNDFIFASSSASCFLFDSISTWNSPQPLTYKYNGTVFNGCLGNHWSDYAGVDGNNDGIGDTPYPIGADQDNYPLMQRCGNYETDSAPSPYSPNPYGYSFPNDTVATDDRLTWWTDEGISSQSKRHILAETFDLSGVDQVTQDMWFDALNAVDGGWGTGGLCYGMASSSLMEYAHPNYDTFLEDNGLDYISDLAEPQKRPWYDPVESGEFDASGDISQKPVLEHLISFQITQHALQDRVWGTERVLDALRMTPTQSTYVMGIYDTPNSDGKRSAHALVPFRVDTVAQDTEYRVHVYDSNHPNEEDMAVIFRKDSSGEWRWEYSRGCTLFGCKVWSGPSTSDEPVDKSICLISIELAYNGGNQLRLPGTGRAQAAMCYVLGEASVTLVDSNGCETGFDGTSFSEEIPNVTITYPMTAVLDEQGEGQSPAYYLSEDTDLQYVITGRGSLGEDCSLLKLGRGYSVEFSGTTGESNTRIVISADGSAISVCGAHDEYGLVVHNGDLGQSFTVSDISSTPSAIHRYTIDWNALVQGEEGVALQIDSDGDGVLEQTITSDATLEPPTAQTGGPYLGDEGSTITFDASGSHDPDGTIVSYQWDFGDGSPTAYSQVPTHTYGDNGVYTVTLTVTDDDGLTGTATASVTVGNVAPIVGPITASVDPVPVGTLVAASASFMEPGVLDTDTAMWDWGDSTTSSGTVTESSGSGTVAGSHTYIAAGIYTIRLTVTDDDGASGESIFQYVVVYDPSTGFVTGGGWINSPVGAYPADPSVTGKATFGFVAKYQKGKSEPTGQTQFQFSVAGFDFKSTSYQWLVVSGAKAKYKGWGTINGMGEYGFMLSAIDGQISGGGGVDKFRIKIWVKGTDVVIYDNQLGADDDAVLTTAISGGSIVIHATKSVATAGVSSIPYLGYVLAGLLGCCIIAVGVFTFFMWGRPLPTRD